MANFHISKRLDKINADPAKVYTWELSFPDIVRVAPSVTDPDNFIIRCRNAVIPSRGNEKIESFFFGMKTLHAGKPVFTHTMSVMFEEFEDQMLAKGFYEWNNQVFSTSLKSPNPGVSQQPRKKGGYAIDAILTQYKQDGEQLEKQYKIFNVFPENIDDVSLDYATNDSIKYALTLSFDYWDFL